MTRLATLHKDLFGAAKTALIGDVRRYQNTAYSTEVTERVRRRDNSCGRVYPVAQISPKTRIIGKSAVNPLALMSKVKRAVVSIGEYSDERGH